MRTNVQFDTPLDLYALADAFAQKNGLALDAALTAGSKKTYIKKPTFWSGGWCMSVEKNDNHGTLEFWLPEPPAWFYPAFPAAVFFGMMVTSTLTVALGGAVGAAIVIYGFAKPALAKSPGIHSDGWVAKLPKAKIRGLVNPFLQELGAQPIT
jgi:hypothetical protein